MAQQEAHTVQIVGDGMDGRWLTWRWSKGLFPPGVAKTEGLDDAVAMLDGKQTFGLIDPTGIDIYWGAYLGTADEILIAGDLAEKRDEILRVRAEAVERKGWVFDTYLLRRR